MLTWLKANKWYVLAYVVFIAVFWFWKAQQMSAFEAYFGLVALHVAFLFGVWIVKRITAKK